MIETRKTEIRYVTSDPKKMLNMYLAKRVLKTWEESFIDEDTGETVTIERNEILFDRGTLIDQDTLAKIRFSMEADGIKEVEVSNLKNKEEECEKQAKEKGHEFRKREIHTAIESAKPIPVGRFIPKEFSMAYME